MTSSGESPGLSFATCANVLFLAGQFTCNALRSVTLRISTNRIGEDWREVYGQRRLLSVMDHVI
jgi:hypothetical protein